LNRQQSEKLFEEAKKKMPGGVNSPVRAFKSVGGTPVFVDYASGCRIYDVDGNNYIDYVLSWGPLILGHAYPSVVKALREAVKRGTSYGAPTRLENMLAEQILAAYPSMQRVRLVNSGTEATMSAIRVARGYTGRDYIVKFEGCYHGHSDGLLVKAGSGTATFALPDSAGVPADYAKYTIPLPFNDIKALRETIEKHGNNIACVIIEPVAGNMGCVLPVDGYLQQVREITSKHDIVLIFDEVMTGFRVAYGGAQAFYGIDPDMTCLGKVIGGGLPVGAYGGKDWLMSMIAPEGPVYQAGTLSGNPLAVTAGIETVKVLSDPEIYERLEEKGRNLEEGLKDAAKGAKIKTKFYRAGTMFCTYFTDSEVVDFHSALRCVKSQFTKFFHNMLEHGIYIAPSQFESGFLCIAHSDDDIDKTVRAAYESMKKL
jgi:glutamate-1-semialdehyde 2,1-aminomutase